MENIYRFNINKQHAARYIVACKKLGIKPENDLLHHMDWVVKQSRKLKTKEVVNGWHTLLNDTSEPTIPIRFEDKVNFINAVLEIGNGQYSFDDADTIFNRYRNAISAYYAQNIPGDEMASWWIAKVVINDMYYKKMESVWRE